MLFDHKSFDDAIVALANAEAMHRVQRAAYMKEIRALGVDLRKKLCKKGGLTKWIQCTHQGNSENLNWYGVIVHFDGNDPACVEAITKHMESEGWRQVRVSTTSAFSTYIAAY